MGYRRRTGFLAGLTVAQISEFSIVFVAMGVALEHVGVSALSLTTLVGLVTITISTYMILYSHPLYERLAPWLRVFERKRPWREMRDEAAPRDAAHADVIVVGLGRYGSRLLSQLSSLGIPVMGVDFDPEAVRALRARGLPAHYGDGEDVAFVETLPLHQARWVVSTLPQWAPTEALLHALRAAGYAGQVAAAARDPQHALALSQTEVTWVLNPFDDAADHAAERLRADLLAQETPT
jgi:hypothetical protein